MAGLGIVLITSTMVEAWQLLKGADPLGKVYASPATFHAAPLPPCFILFFLRCPWRRPKLAVVDTPSPAPSPILRPPLRVLLLRSAAS